MMPLYCTGISQPAKSTMRAPEGAVRIVERRALHRPAPAATARRDGARLGSGDGVLQQHRDGHRADAARHRGDERGALAGALELDVADQLAVGAAVGADVDDHRAGLDPVAADQLRLADRGDQHVGAADLGGQVARARVADGHRRVALEQQERHRLADQVAAPDDHGARALAARRRWRRSGA